MDKVQDRLLNAQRILEEKGYIEGRIYRFLLAPRNGEEEEAAT